jgi:hypothetical protein
MGIEPTYTAWEAAKLRVRRAHFAGDLAVLAAVRSAGGKGHAFRPGECGADGGSRPFVIIAVHNGRAEIVNGLCDHAIVGLGAARLQGALIGLRLRAEIVRPSCRARIRAVGQRAEGPSRSLPSGVGAGAGAFPGALPSRHPAIVTFPGRGGTAMVQQASVHAGIERVRTGRSNAG